MNLSSIVLFSLLFGAVILAVQRTEKKRRWWTGVFFLLPSLWFFWRWSIYNDHLGEYFIACGLSLTLNIVFWLIYGRKNPPGAKGEITVIDGED